MEPFLTVELFGGALVSGLAVCWACTGLCSALPQCADHPRAVTTDLGPKVQIPYGTAPSAGHRGHDWSAHHAHALLQQL
jgi:hypothetical protein